MSTNDQSKYDPNVIIQAAQDKLSQSNDLEGGQMIFQSALLTWVDDAREIMSVPPQGAGAMDYDTMQQAIVTLWLAYAEFLASAHQYKSAMEAYEQAVNCPVGGSVGTIWLSYAQFAQERGKTRTAQQVYIRALVGNNPGGIGAVTDEQEREILWQAFLEMMQRNKPELTLAELEKAVTEEQQQKQKEEQKQKQKEEQHNQPSSAVLGAIASTDSGEMENMPTEASEEPASKRMRLAEEKEEMDVGPTAEEQKIHSISPEAVQMEAKAFLEVLEQKDVPPDILAAWMIRDGEGLAQSPEPPLFAPTPPKFADPTGKDVLGVELALNLNHRLQSTSGTVVLKVVQALWTLSALTEQHTADTIAQMDESLKQAQEAREADFSNRMATAANESVLSAVQSSIEQDRRAFGQACQEQRQSVLTDVAWQMRRLLCAQQQVLTQLQIPKFQGPTVDASTLREHAKIGAYLHAAFFLRNRIGPEPHLALLKAQASRLELQWQEEQEKQQQKMAQQQPMSTTPPNVPMQPPQAGYPVMGGGQAPQYPPYNPQQHQGFGMPPPPPPSYPAYVPQQRQQQPQQNMMQQGPPPHMMQQQPQQQPPYGQGPPYNMY